MNSKSQQDRSRKGSPYALTPVGDPVFYEAGKPET